MSETNKLKLKWPDYWKLVKTSFIEFFREDNFMHGAALAYYAIFALIPIFYLALTSFGAVVGQDKMIVIIRDMMESNMGLSDISLFTELMYKFDFGKSNENSIFLRIVGIIVIVFTSTAMFNSMRKSMNSFLEINPRKKYPLILKNLFSRFISFSILALFGLVIILIYFAQTILLSMSSKLLSNHVFFEQIVFGILKNGSLILTNFILFSFIFMFLHDGKVKWKMALGGSLFTSILLYLGHLLINYYLSNYFFAADSGLAGTLLVILAWIFYSSQIIFLGAKFTKVYARMLDEPIKPR